MQSLITLLGSYKRKVRTHRAKCQLTAGQKLFFDGKYTRKNTILVEDKGEKVW